MQQFVDPLDLVLMAVTTYWLLLSDFVRSGILVSILISKSMAWIHFGLVEGETIPNLDEEEENIISLNKFNEQVEFYSNQLKLETKIPVKQEVCESPPSVQKISPELAKINFSVPPSSPACSINELPKKTPKDWQFSRGIRRPIGISRFNDTKLSPESNSESSLHDALGFSPMFDSNTLHSPSESEHEYYSHDLNNSVHAKKLLQQQYLENHTCSCQNPTFIPILIPVPVQPEPVKQPPTKQPPTYQTPVKQPSIYQAPVKQPTYQVPSSPQPQFNNYHKESTRKSVLAWIQNNNPIIDKAVSIGSQFIPQSFAQYGLDLSSSQHRGYRSNQS